MGSHLKYKSTEARGSTGLLAKKQLLSVGNLQESGARLTSVIVGAPTACARTLFFVVLLSFTMLAGETLLKVFKFFVWKINVVAGG